MTVPNSRNSEEHNILEYLHLFTGRTALLYRFGQEAYLREDGSIPEEETPERVAQLYNMARRRPATEQVSNKAIIGAPGDAALTSHVLGTTIAVKTNGGDDTVIFAHSFLVTLKVLSPYRSELWLILNIFQ